jgi:hypothetical protein
VKNNLYLQEILETMFINNSKYKQKKPTLCGVKPKYSKGDRLFLASFE